MDLGNLDFDIWMSLGIEKGWVGPPICLTHDGLPTTPDEDEQMEQGEEVCVHIIRPYRDLTEKADIEENHSPSVWRNRYQPAVPRPEIL